MIITTKLGLKKALENNSNKIIVEGPFASRLIGKINLSNNYIKKYATGTLSLSPILIFLLFGTYNSIKILKTLNENYTLTYKDMNFNKLIFQKTTK